MWRTKKIDEAIYECYIQLYKNSEPTADFQKLVDEAHINERGQKIIDFNSYEISEKKYYEIIECILKEKKLSKFEKTIVKNSVALGCSPKFKK
jgi:phosphotransferase system IIA component